jgi:DUF971 family protein
VPEDVRREWSRWGRCRDEFTDHDGWPRMFYVRNGRRLVGDFVLTEAHVRRADPTPVDDPVALAWWPPDLHHARRLVRDGAVWNEGAIFGGDTWRPFGIAWRALVPRATECTNLLTPTCPSSSYVAYGALRLEWTFMAIAQSAALAASLALERGVSVQDVPYAELRARLLAAGQVLAAPRGGGKLGRRSAAPAPPTDPHFPFAPPPGVRERRPMHAPVNIQLIGNEVAIAWADGAETYVTCEKLRAASPSAANIGERDILGNQYGGDGPKRFPGVTVTGWEQVGNYAIRFDFSDGHRTGLYAYDYLRRLG